MENSTKQDKKAKIIILVVTLVLTVLFATLAGVLPGNSNSDPNGYNGSNGGNSNGSNGGNNNGMSISGSLSLNVSKNVTLTGSDYVYYSFIPTSSGTYNFTSISNYDTYGVLYNASENQLSSNDDGGDGQNFLISYYLYSGNTYYLGVRIYDSGMTGSRTVTVTVSR